MRILWIPHASWETPQRAHFFCRALARRHEIHVADSWADFAHPVDYASLRYLRNYFYGVRRDDGIVVHHIPRVSPALFSPLLRRLNYGLYARYVRQVVRRYDVDTVVSTFVTPPPVARRLVFDLFDDNSSYWRDTVGNPAYAAEIDRIEAAYIERADAVAAISSVLCDKAAAQLPPPQRHKVHLIPNGIDLARYETGDGQSIRQKLGLADYKVVGLISALGEFTGLLRLVEAFRVMDDDEVALLVVGSGPYLEPARRRAKELGLSRVVFTGQVPFSQIPGYYRALDVGLLPFDKTPFTDAACPIKLLEYSAAGKVVVSTDLTEVRRMGFPNVVFADTTPAALAEGIREALQRPFQAPASLSGYDGEKLVARYESLLQGA
ncbi:MAG: glycosyltransferase [Dehalococcoidales bacterium]|nr:glycosyltransferase [Dehalococcoidales bacterium]